MDHEQRKMPKDVADAALVETRWKTEEQRRAEEKQQPVKPMRVWSWLIFLLCLVFLWGLQRLLLSNGHWH